MKKKLDLSFIVFLVIVIAGGIFLNKLAEQRNQLVHENKVLNQVLESQDFFINELENLYLQSLLPRKGNNGLEEKVCLSWPASVADSTENKLFHEIVSQLSNLPPEKVCLCFPTELPADFNAQISSLGFEMKVCPDMNDRALFYINATGKIEAYFPISPYSLPLLKKYLKLIRENYVCV